MKNAGYEPVPSYNPYWDKHGVTFADPDDYRVVLQNDTWTDATAASQNIKYK